MKKISFFCLLLLCITACKQTPTSVQISGEIKGLGSDTLYIYGMDDGYDQIDTIIAEKDKFTFHTQVDTITSLYLLFHNKIEYPVFIDKNDQITIQGDTSTLNRLLVKGNMYNEQMNTFNQQISQQQTNVKQAAEEFIREHHTSYVSLYLLDKYFVQTDEPDYTLINKLLEQMTGVLQDKPYVEELKSRMNQAQKTTKGKYAPFFSLYNQQGKRITRNSEEFRQKCMLINFWASWADSTANQKNEDTLKEIYSSYRKNKYLAMLGISFDIDKEAWKNSIKRDTLKWEQVCEPDGINGELGKQFALNRLPCNIILSAEGIILAKDLKGEELKNKLKEVIKETEEKAKKKKK